MEGYGLCGGPGRGKARWIGPVKGGKSCKEGQGRVVRFMEGWGWPDEGEEGQEKVGEPKMVGKDQGLLERPGRVKRARDFFIDSQGRFESQSVLKK